MEQYLTLTPRHSNMLDTVHCIQNDRCISTLNIFLQNQCHFLAPTVTTGISGTNMLNSRTSRNVYKILNGQVAVPAASVDLTLSDKPSCGTNAYKKAQLSLTNPHDAKSLTKIAPIRRAYNVVADNTGLSSLV